ncbi:TPA: hypothetical protein EYP38_05015 [Candidatus Micrarchaeota archaeon]|nr:hypothetical protein [Candidatus Micrarchaeota archaeon]
MGEPAADIRAAIAKRAETIVTERKQDKKGRQTSIEYKGRIFHMVGEPKDNWDNFGWIYRGLMKIAKLNSKIDIASGYAFLAVATAGGIAMVGYFGSLIGGMAYYSHLAEDVRRMERAGELTPKQMEQMMPLVTRLTDIMSVPEFFAAFVAFTAVLTVYGACKKLLDDTQRVLMNQMLRKVRNDMPDKYHGFLEREKEFREYDDAERIEGGFFKWASNIPVFGLALAPRIKEYYNLKYEKKQLQAIREMKKFLAE